MRFEPFGLERWLPVISAEINLAGALCLPASYADIIPSLDLSQPVSYGSTRGSERLSEGVAALYDRGEVRADNVLITTGTAEANFLTLSSLLEPGDEFVVVTPTYLQSIGLSLAMGAIPRTVPLQEERGWWLDPDRLESAVSIKTKAILITNPNNPTGSCLNEQAVADTCRVAERFGAYVIADEALRGLEASGVAAPSPAELYERGMSTGSLSKIGLSGLRIGWVVGPKPVVEQCWAHKDYTTLAHSGLGEILAESALRPEVYGLLRERARDTVRQHSAIFMDWIEQNSSVLSCVRPEGGGSAFPAYHCQGEMDSVSLCRRALERVSVALSPGDYFGAPGHFRLRYGTPPDVLREGLSRLSDFFAKLQ